MVTQEKLERDGESEYKIEQKLDYKNPGESWYRAWIMTVTVLVEKIKAPQDTF